MSFIREIVETVCENEIIDAKKNLTKISSEIKKYQEKTKDFIDRNYVEFLPNITNGELYLSEGDRFLIEVEGVLQQIENDTKQDLYSASEELRQYKEELIELALSIRTARKILTIDKYFQYLEEAKSNQEFLIVMDIVSKLKTLINDPNDILFAKLSCYPNIKIKYHIESEMLLHNLKQRFEQLVQFTEKSFQNTKSVTIKISKDKTQLNDTIIALFNAKYNPRKMCDFLLENVFTAIITKPVSINLNEDAEKYVTLSISYSLKDLYEHLKPSYKEIFKNIEMVIQCLTFMNIYISDNISVLSIFGEHLKRPLLHSIINDCLLYAIPETMDEMQDSTLVEDITTFNTFLIEVNLIEEEDNELLKHSDNIDILFRNRFCTKILDSSIEIMRKDLHDMTLIVDNNTASDEDSNSFTFPRCMVSTSTLELICLMEKIFRQTLNCDSHISEKLLSTISAIIDKYIIEVPQHHKKMLENIPQQTALFHNNCMHLSHWLNKNLDKGIPLLSNLIKSLQKLGSDHFLQQIKNQRSQLLEILKNFDLSNALSEAELEPQKITRQCLRQLDLLKNVWQTILPEIIYNKTMINLLNDFCGEVIHRIMSVEDLPKSLANELVEIIGLIEERAPTVFQEKHQVLQIKLWMKLTQLKMILSASLIQITDQWADGKGPLPLNYKPEEVKHLIRALFQNTDRRANALALIV